MKLSRSIWKTRVRSLAVEIGENHQQKIRENLPPPLTGGGFFSVSAKTFILPPRERKANKQRYETVRKWRVEVKLVEFRGIEV